MVCHPTLFPIHSFSICILFFTSSTSLLVILVIYASHSCATGRWWRKDV